ncbi:MAG: MBL fold metallo-hydrolase [Proteobacteria bacterium]|nr:MAG: MBL fold metallo-hydrolase [Pseudomonadota bacterium]
MTMTRRHALAGAAALAATPAIARSAKAQPAKAQSTAPGGDLRQAPGYYRYRIGEALVTVVSDGANTFPRPAGFVANVKPEEVGAALEKLFRPRDTRTIPFGPLAVRTGNKLIVIDTGNGEAAHANSKGAVGQFAANFAAAGFDPARVDAVVISHFHGDHINGLIKADGSPAFPNAEVLVPEREWAFFMDDGEMSRASGERMQGVFKNARRVFDALKRKVTPYAWDKEVAPGLLALATVGHTPGHTSFVLSSGSDKVFIQSDVTNDPGLFAQNPGWHLIFDQDPAQAEATRRRVYDMLVADRMRVQGFHYPFPGVGHVEKAGDGYRVIPEAWRPVI